MFLSRKNLNSLIEIWARHVWDWNYLSAVLRGIWFIWPYLIRYSDHWSSSVLMKRMHLSQNITFCLAAHELLFLWKTLDCIIGLTSHFTVRCCVYYWCICHIISFANLTLPAACTSCLAFDTCLSFSSRRQGLRRKFRYQPCSVCVLPCAPLCSGVLSVAFTAWCLFHCICFISRSGPLHLLIKAIEKFHYKLAYCHCFKTMHHFQIFFKAVVLKIFFNHSSQREAVTDCLTHDVFCEMIC